MKKGYTYILTNKYVTVLYVGVTANLETRIQHHKDGTGSSFCRKYQVCYLVYYEEHQDIKQAIRREKQLKNWHRDWKMNLIKSLNPEWQDLLTGEKLTPASR